MTMFEENRQIESLGDCGLTPTADIPVSFDKSLFSHRDVLLPEASVSLINAFLGAYRQGDSTALNPETLVDFVRFFRASSTRPEVVHYFAKDASIDRKQFQNVCLDIEAITEKNIAHAYLRGNSAWLEERLQGFNGAYYRNEAGLVTLENQQVYFIGSGALPNSAMVYYECAGLKPICVDFDDEALELSRDIILKRYGRRVLDTHFAFIKTDACELLYAPTPITWAIISGHCLNKRLILENMWIQCSEQSRIMLRPSRGLYRYIYDTVELEDLHGFRPAGEINTETLQSQMLASPIILMKHEQKLPV